MTVEERRSVRESLAPLGDWGFTVVGLSLACPACLADEWMEGKAVVLMKPITEYANFHYRCPECGLKEFADFLLFDLCRDVPEHASCWN